MKLCNIYIKNLIILSVSGIFKGFKNWQKVAEICYQLVHDRVSRGLALFLIWRNRHIYMALTLREHGCKTVCDVKSGKDRCPSPARSRDKEYQISGCTSLCKHECKEVCDVKQGIGPYPLLAWSCDRWWPDFVTFAACKRSIFGLKGARRRNAFQIGAKI